MESGQKFFTAKNLMFLNKQIKSMYNNHNWPELDKALPSLASEWLDWFCNYRIADDLRVLNAEFLKYMSTFFHVQKRDPVWYNTEGATLTPSGRSKYDKFSGEFMSLKDPFLEYQNTTYQQIQMDERTAKKTRSIYNDMTLGNMPVYDMLNPEEHFFLKGAFDIGAKSMRRTERKATQDQVFEDYIKDSLETGHPRKFYSVNEQAMDNFYKNEDNYFKEFDPTGPGTAYDKHGVVSRKYTRDPTPYNVNGVDLRNPKYERQYLTMYAGAKY